jgi:U3 small nucleolar RNA-associated protein 13
MLTYSGNGQDSQEVTCFCLSPSSRHLCVFTTVALRIYELSTLFNTATKISHPIRVIAHPHDAAVHVCKVDPTSSYLASGSADGVVKVWDIVRGFITHVFKGHGGVVSALTFKYTVDPSSPSGNAPMFLISASVDTRIRVFELTSSKATGKAVAVLEGHMSVPRGLEVSADGNWLISGGRDSVVLIWDISPLNLSPKSKTKSPPPVLCKLIKTIPVLEGVEALGLLHDNEPLVQSAGTSLLYTGGEKGMIRIWDLSEGKCIQNLGEDHVKTSDAEIRQILHIVSVLYICHFVRRSSLFFSDTFRPRQLSYLHMQIKTSSSSPCPAEL